jgi:hypothetical protein
MSIDALSMPSELEVVDYDRILSMINDASKAICECSLKDANNIDSKLNTIEGGLKQIIAEVIEETYENQTVTISSGNEFRVTI